MAENEQCPPNPPILAPDGTIVRPGSYDLLRRSQGLITFLPRKERTKETACFEQDVAENFGLLPDHILRFLKATHSKIKVGEFAEDGLDEKEKEFNMGMASDPRTKNKNFSAIHSKISGLLIGEKYEDEQGQIVKNTDVPVTVEHETGHEIANQLGLLRGDMSNIIDDDSERKPFSTAYRKDLRNFVQNAKNAGRNPSEVLKSALDYFYPPEFIKARRIPAQDTEGMKRAQQETYAELWRSTYTKNSIIPILFPESAQHVQRLDKRLAELHQEHSDDQAYLESITKMLQTEFPPNPPPRHISPARHPRH